MAQGLYVPEVMPSFYNRRASAKELRVLLVADVHCALSNVHRLAELLTSRSEYVDMIWVAGDLTCLQPQDYEIPARLAASEGDMSAVISALENIQCRVAYVPGSHDPSSSAVVDSAGPRLTPHSCNLHGRCLRVAPDLVLVGCGGDAGSWSDRERRCLGSLLALPSDAPPGSGGVGSDVVTAEDSVVLLTHTRPQGGEGAGEGATRLAGLLQEESAQKCVVVNVHGGRWEEREGGAERKATAGEEDEEESSEQGFEGVGNVGNVRVVAGGSLAEGDFCLLTLVSLRRGSAQGKGWRLSRCQRMSVHGTPSAGKPSDCDCGQEVRLAA